MDKIELRVFYKERIENLTDTEKEEQSQALQKRLALFLAKQSGNWSLYSPLQDEPHLLELMEMCKHLSWCFPIIRSKNEALEFYQVRSTENMIKSSWGVLEPDPTQCQKMPMALIDGFIVPGVAFDKSGVRLGRGVGHFDRTLKNSKAIKIGVCFDSALADQLIKENHDQSMNIVASPSDWIEISSTEFRKEVSHVN